jgi:prefoldin subunit 5
MARAHRRREAEEALAFERERADSLREEIERLVAELEGPRVDEQAFARMAPEDAELVRDLIQPAEVPDDETWAAEDDEELFEAPDPRAELEEEIARLEEEIADSSRRQEALQRYVEALG